MPMMNEPLRHVGAHAAETDHAEFHRFSPLLRRCPDEALFGRRHNSWTPPAPARSAPRGATSSPRRDARGPLPVADLGHVLAMTDDVLLVRSALLAHEL